VSAPYQAVILAAGRGSRLGNRTGEIPKAMLPLGPRSTKDSTETCFLRRQIEVLKAAGVDQVTVVVGYLREAILRGLEDWKLGVDVALNPTPEIQTSGSLHSLQFAMNSGKGILDGTKQTLFMDADIVYDRRVLKLLLDAPEENALLICGKIEQDSEEVLVHGSLEKPRFLAKGLTEELAGGAPCLGEAVGIVKLAPRDHGLARRTIDWLLGDSTAPEGTPKYKGFGPARRATEHEELTQRFMHYQRMRAVVFGTELAFMEVDAEHEYEECTKHMYPKLLADEARLGLSL
jgi:choline kinase